MGTTIRGIAHLNELTKDVVADYYVKPELKGTLHADDIVARLAKREIATHNVDGRAFVTLFMQECAAAVVEGYNVVTDLFHAGISVHGVAHSKDLGRTIPASQLDVRVHFTQGAVAHAAISGASVAVAEQLAPTGPDIQSVCNPTLGEPNALSAGGMALVQGLRIAVRGDQAEAIGVYFSSVVGSREVRIPAAQLSPNTPTKLQFVLPPTVTPGEWRLSVRTQSTGNSASFTKEVRECLYPFTVAVV
ncbi:MAG: DUF4469 domain-containing protein [Prevotellaceae bacterium]|jgi:hypothetical protein|nr:DUF4469 domain-containing protein [Prevotellaceae bacterium]